MPNRDIFATGELLMNEPLKRQLLYMEDITQLTGKHPVTLRRWWNNGKFPKPTKHSVLVWRADVIDEWINKTMRGNDHE